MMDSATRAAWVSATAAAVAVVASVGLWIASERQANRAAQAREREDLFIYAEPVTRDYPTRITALPQGKTGRIAVYWSLLTSNNGERASSLVRYQVRTVEDAYGVIVIVADSGLDQGLYTTTLAPLELPLTIEVGHARRFYIRIGTIMSPKAYSLAKARWRTGDIPSFHGLVDHLHKRGYDISPDSRVFDFGNRRINPWLKRGEDVVALVTFTTGKGTKVQAAVAGGPFSYRLPQRR